MDLCGGFAGHKDDPPPVPLEHAWKVVPRQADASQEIDLEVSQPVLVSDVREVLRFISTSLGVGNHSLPPQTGEQVEERLV